MRSAREISGNLRQPCRASRPTTCAALLTFKYQHSTELGFGQLADFYLFRSQDEKRRSHAFKEENAADYMASALKQRRFFTRQIRHHPNTLPIDIGVPGTDRRDQSANCNVKKPLCSDAAQPNHSWTPFRDSSHKTTFLDALQMESRATNLIIVLFSGFSRGGNSLPRSDHGRPKQNRSCTRF